MSYLGAGADWRKRNYLIAEDAPVCANTGAVNRVTAAQFVAGVGLITFNEFPNGTVNPVYTRGDYGGTQPWEPRLVTFCPALLGQTFSSPPLTNNGDPTPPPAFEDYGGLLTRIVNDSARPVGEERSIAGAPGFSGPVSMFFTEVDGVTPAPVVGVGMNIGSFNDIGLCRVRAWDAAGVLLGTWSNVSALPTYQDFFLNRDSNVPIIAAVALDAIGDTAGLSVSRIRFSNSCA